MFLTYAVAVLACSLPVPVPADAGRVTVPVERNRHGLFFVRASIEGVPCQLLVDTGRGKTVLGGPVIDRIREQQPGGKIRRVAVGGFEWAGGGRAVGGWPSYDESQRDWPTAGGPCVGYLGADFLTGFNAALDTGTNALSFDGVPRGEWQKLAGRWRSVAAERRGRVALAPAAEASSLLDIDAHRLSFSGPAHADPVRMAWTVRADLSPKMALGLTALAETPTRGAGAPPKKTGAIFHYEVTADRLTLVERGDDTRTPLAAMRMTTANDPDAVMYYYVRVGSIPDARGRTAADYVPWTALAKRYGVALDGPYRVGNFDYSLNRDLSVTGVEVGGPTTITWDLEGSRVVRRGPRVNASR